MCVNSRCLDLLQQMVDGSLPTLLLNRDRTGDRGYLYQGVHEHSTPETDQTLSLENHSGSPRSEEFTNPLSLF